MADSSKGSCCCCCCCCCCYCYCCCPAHRVRGRRIFIWKLLENLSEIYSNCKTMEGTTKTLIELSVTEDKRGESICSLTSYEQMSVTLAVNSSPEKNCLLRTDGQVAGCRLDLPSLPELSLSNQTKLLCGHWRDVCLFTAAVVWISRSSSSSCLWVIGRRR